MTNNSRLIIPLRQHGNSVGLTIPKPYLEALGLSKGSWFDLELKDGVIEMRPYIEALPLEQLIESYDSTLHNYDNLLPGECGKEVFEPER